jgi:hypothetical protein
MNIEQQVASYYTHGKLEDKILGMLRNKNVNTAIASGVLTPVELVATAS